MSEYKQVVDQDLKCPDCGREFHAHASVKWSPEIMTVKYRVDEGRKMPLEELCSSLLGLAKALKLTAKELGVKALVTPMEIKIEEDGITVTIAIVGVSK